MKFAFIGPAYTSHSVNVNAQRCVNLYPEVDETGKNIIALYGCPGLRLLATVGNGPVRGMWPVGEFLYVVSGPNLYKVDTNFASTLLGVVGGTGPVSMAANRTQLMVVNGSAGYIVTLATAAFAAISDADFPAGPVTVAYMDGYFIVNDADTETFYISTLADGTSWDAADYASAEGFPDDIVSILVDHRELWLFGGGTTEVWYNSGDADFPFERMQGAFLEHGCAAPFSAAKMDNSVYWLGKDDKGRGMVFRAQGYSPLRVSTHAIEYAIRGYSTISDAIAFTYQMDGHSFYVLTFPTEGKTWVFDAATQMWHERAYLSPTDGTLTRHRANCHAYFNGFAVVGDYQNGKLYELDPDTYTDAGDEILALRSCPHVSDQGDLNRVFHHRLQIDLEAGAGLTTGQGSDPQIMLRWSDDGGHKWSNEHWTGMGKLGEYKTRAVWRRLGSSRDRVYEASITDPIRRVLISASLRATPGNA